MSTVDHWIEAGAIAALPVGGAAPGDAASAQPLLMQTFVHPCLDRRVVRLWGASAQRAGLAEMGLLGFRAAGPQTQGGLVRAQALGFPAWTLLHEPQLASAVRALMPELRAAMAIAFTQPGHAFKAFQKLASRFDAPLWPSLPSFWETAGRHLMNAGSPELAARCFEAARQAERTYALPVDFVAREAVFAEFALGGALSAKTCSAHLKVLTQQLKAPQALAHYLQLSVYRIQGGQPPAATLPQELAKLAKAARRDRAEVEAQFLAQLLTVPTLQRMPLHFWEAYLPALPAAATRSAQLTGRALWIFPELREAPAKLLCAWVEALAQISTAAYWHTQPAEAAARWIAQITTAITPLLWAPSEVGGGLPAAYVGCLASVAPALIAAQQPVELGVRSQHWPYTRTYVVDVLEHALAAGIDLAFHDAGWTVSVAAHPQVDPQWLAQRADLIEAFGDAVWHEAERPDFQALLREKPGYGVAFRHALEQAILYYERPGGVMHLENALYSIKDKVSAFVRTECPDLYARIAQLSVATALQRSLRGGLLDEFAWPDFEAALADCAGSPEAPISLRGSTHYPVIQCGAAVTIFKGARWLRMYQLEETITQVHQLIYVCPEVDEPLSGDLYVNAYRSQRGHEVFWVSQPEVSAPSFAQFKTTAFDVRLPTGQILCDGMILQPGVVEPPAFEEGLRLCWDGEQIYEVYPKSRAQVDCFEWDAQTRQRGTAAWPVPVRAWLAEWPGACIEQLWISTAPWGTEDSPLGAHAGLVGGWRYRASEAQIGRIYRRIDGVSVQNLSAEANGLLKLPAAQGYAPIRFERAMRAEEADEVQIFTEAGEVLTRFGRNGLGPVAFRCFPRWQWLHFVQARDQRLSAALRAVRVEDAEAMLAAAAEDLPSLGAPVDETLPVAQRWPHSVAAVEARLGPGDAGLLGAVAQLVIYAQRQKLALEEHLASLD